MSVGDKKKFGKTLGPKVFQIFFYHQRTNIHDFIPIFFFFFVTDLVTDFVTHFVTVFVTDFVNKYLTLISCQITYLLGTFCLPNLQIPNYNQLCHPTGILGTCLAHICYPQTLKRQRYLTFQSNYS